MVQAVSKTLEQYNLYDAQCIGFALLIFRFSTGVASPIYSANWFVVQLVEKAVGDYVSWSLHERDEFADHLDKTVSKRLKDAMENVRNFETEFEAMKKDHEATVLQQSEAPSKANSAMEKTIAHILAPHIPK